MKNQLASYAITTGGYVGLAFGSWLTFQGGPLNFCGGLAIAAASGFAIYWCSCKDQPCRDDATTVGRTARRKIEQKTKRQLKKHGAMVRVVTGVQHVIQQDLLTKFFEVVTAGESPYPGNSFRKNEHPKLWAVVSDRVASYEYGRNSPCIFPVIHRCTDNVVALIIVTPQLEFTEENVPHGLISSVLTVTKRYVAC